MPRSVAMLLLLFLVGSIVWWQVSFIRMRLSAEEFAGERGVLITFGSFVTIILGLNAMNLVGGLHIEFEMWFDSGYGEPSRLVLLLRQIGLLSGFYVFAMVFWYVIRRRALDLEKEIWEPRIEYGLTELQRLAVGAALAIVSVPAVVRYGSAPFGRVGIRGALILLVMVPVCLFAIELLFGALLTKFMRRIHEQKKPG